MKSQESVLLHVVRGILKDVQAAYPAMRGLDLDFEKLTLQCQARGQALFMLDLPHLDSLLLEGLECGRLTSKGPLTSVVSKEVKVPKLFSGLWLRVFDKQACLRQDADPTSIFFLRQLCCLGKKLEVECSYDRIQTVLENYHVVERNIREPTLGWYFDELDPDDRLGSLHFVQALDGPTFDPNQYEAFTSIGKDYDYSGSKASDRNLLTRLQQVADVVCGTFDFFDPHQRAVDLDAEGKGIGFKHGPGAVSERMKNWEKSQFQFWPDKLEALFPFEFCGKTIGSDRSRPSNHELASRLICVPKTYKGPRLIAAEPASHQWCQQSILSFMNEQFGRHFHGYFIDLHDQRKSNDLVLEASRDRSLATVDLSDASDRLSCWTVERALRKHCSLLHHLHAARTRLLRDDISKDPSFLRLKKFASQGTATTFPVQSLVFLIIALTASVEGEISWQKIWKLRNRVRVFGDDIILPTHGYEQLIRIMDILGLKVNMAKSYVKGHFRESCGVDGYKGYDVTPVKPKTLVADSPASCQAVVDTSNNLFNKGLWYASDSLTNTLPPRIRRGLRVVDRHDVGFSGLASCSGSDESHLKRRWNSRLHRHEVRVWVLRGPARRETEGGFHCLLDFFSSKHNYEHARIVSEHSGIRKTRDGFLWEPLNSGARVVTLSRR
uniref:RNA-directed RNA polymerase n=1 Tax=Leviviridae sp. TaxID=2027243 RepID=A0A514DBJ3_9VIRU|nr:MAG: RNA-dependent RNA polymerase [Leviviridae sp.]